MPVSKLDLVLGGKGVPSAASLSVSSRMVERAFRDGSFVLPDDEILFWAKQNDRTIQEMSELVVLKRLRPTDALSWLRDEVAIKTRVAELLNRCNGAGGHVELDVECFHFVVTRHDFKGAEQVAQL